MSEALTLRHYAVLLLVTTLLAAGALHLTARPPENPSVTENAATPPVDSSTTQPLFPGQPNADSGR